MINQVRTALFNQSGLPGALATYPGEEFVPADYVAKTLPLPLLRVWHTLFGATPDRAMLNYRLRQYMPLLHASRLEQFVLTPDPRVTYWPMHDMSLYLPATFGPTVTPIGATTTALYPQNTSTTLDYNTLLRSWIISVTDGTHVHITQTQGGVLDVTLTYTISSGVSNTLTIPGTSYSFFFQAGIGAEWLYTIMARPVLQLTDIVNNLDSSDSVDALFGPAEPYLTFSNLWQYRDELPFRLGAVLLALAYQIVALP